MSVQDSRPTLSPSQVSELLKRLFQRTPSQLRPLPSYDDQNFYVTAEGGGEFVLKVMNSADSQNAVLYEVQTHAMNLLSERGFPTQTTLPTRAGPLISLEEIDCGFGRRTYLVRLLTYLPGTVISKIPCSPQILYDVGKMAAGMDKVLQEMEHPELGVLQRQNYIWNLNNIPLLEPYLPLMDGEPVQQVVKSIIEQYKTLAVPKLSSFRKCINHGDLNDHNILVEPDDSSGYRISGILDFGDMSAGYYVYELAITVMYMMIESPTPLEVGGHVLAGWESVIPLNQSEKEALYLLVMCRFCQSLVLARHTVAQQPDNEEYLMITSKTGIRHLCRLWELGKEEVERMWFQSAAQYSAQDR